MIKTEIGSLVDWIDERARFRGLVVVVGGGYAQIAVLGSNFLHTQPLDRLVPVRSSRDFITYSK